MAKSSAKHQLLGATVDRAPEVISYSNGTKEFIRLVVSTDTGRDNEPVLHEIAVFFKDVMEQAKDLRPGMLVNISGDVGSRVKDDYINASLGVTHIFVNPDDLAPPPTSGAGTPGASEAPAGDDDDDLPF